MKKGIVSLILLTLVAKVIAFGKELVLAYCYGTSEISDAYLISMVIPVTLFGFFSSGIVSGFIPLYGKVRHEEGEQGALCFSNRILILFLGLGIFLIVAYFVFRIQLIGFVANGFSDNAKRLALQYSDITIFSLVFSCITHIVCVYLQSIGKSLYFGFLSVPLNLVIAISVAVSYRRLDSYLLAYGYVLATVFQCFVFLFIGYRYRFRFRLGRTKILSDKYTRLFLQSILTLTIGSSVYQINVLVDKMLAGTAGVGGVAALEFAAKIFNLISGLFIISIGTVQFPKMVEQTAVIEKFKACMDESLEYLFAFLFPITIVILVYAREIVQVIYVRGAFGEEALVRTSGVLFFYGVGLIPIGVREILSKSFYARGDMKTPVRNAIVGVFLNCLLDIAFVKWIGICGLALATSITALLVAIRLHWQMKKEIDYSIWIRLKTKLLLSASGSGLAIIGSYFVYSVYPCKDVVGILTVLFVFLGVYVLFAWKYNLLNFNDILLVRNK